MAMQLQAHMECQLSDSASEYSESDMEEEEFDAYYDDNLDDLDIDKPEKSNDPKYILQMENAARPLSAEVEALRSALEALTSTSVPEKFAEALQRGHNAEWRFILSGTNSKEDLGQCLLEAVRLGSVEAVEGVLCLRPPLDSRDKEGKGALLLAVEQGSARTCRQLLQHLSNSRPLAQCADRREPVREVSTSVDGSGEQSVLNLVDNCGCTALHQAIILNRKDFVEMFLEAGADTDSIAYKGMLPLELAIREVESRCNYEYYEYVERMHDMADLRIVRMLLKHNPDVVTKDGQHPIHLVLSSKLLHELALEMIQQSAPERINVVNNRQETPLHLVCEMDPTKLSLDLVKELLAKGVSVNAVDKNNMYALSYAMRQKDKDMVLMLLEANARVDIVDRWSFLPLHYAVQDWDTIMVETLLDISPETISVKTWGMSPLHLAVKQGKLDNVECLLRKGAKIVRADAQILHSAIRALRGLCCLGNNWKGLQLLRLLVDQGADLNVRAGMDALTPLQRLVQELTDADQFCNTESLKLIKLLVDSGAKPDAEIKFKDYSRTTPLEIMADRGWLSSVYYLANVGYPLRMEKNAQSGWLHHQSDIPAQNSLRAYLKLRGSTTWSLKHHARAAIRQALAEKRMAEHGVQKLESLVEEVRIGEFPLPKMLVGFVNFWDMDYSSGVKS